MKSLSCKDLGGECDATFSGESKQEIKEKLFAHSMQKHGDMMASMTPDKVAELNKKIENLLGDL